MRLHRGWPRHAGAPLALTIGNFDGVHLGHQAMLRRLAEGAEDLGLASAVLTFEPTPREFFGREAAPARLSGLREKLEQFRRHGIEHVILARFDAALANLAAEDFVQRILVERLAARWVLIGDDFRFGRRRQGDAALLRRASGFTVETLASIAHGEERVSSSGIREALAAGDVDRAARLLGRPYVISGRVAHGAKLGRNLGFPTANLALRYRPATTGVFAVRVHGLGERSHPAVASLGVRPTVASGARPLLEVFIFDFDGDIYGRRIGVELLHKLRDEAKYPDLGALTRQIRRDVEHAREFFSLQH